MLRTHSFKTNFIFSHIALQRLISFDISLMFGEKVKTGLRIAPESFPRRDSGREDFIYRNINRKTRFKEFHRGNTWGPAQLWNEYSCSPKPVDTIRSSLSVTWENSNIEVKHKQKCQFITHPYANEKYTCVQDSQMCCAKSQKNTLFIGNASSNTTHYMV